MKKIIFGLMLSSVLMACSKEDVQPPPVNNPMRNEVRMNFIGVENEDKVFGYNEKLSSVECHYDAGSGNLRMVAYRFVDQGDLQIQESLQLTDFAIQTQKSGFLKTSEEQTVPSFIFLGDPMTLKFSDQSNCSTYYDVKGDEIRGNVLCSALEDEENQTQFVSLEFQCRNQDYLLFEIKKEML